MQQRAVVRLTNARGLHARPCHAIASAALRFQGSLRVVHDGREADAKSILELMMLGVPPGAELELIADGDDAAELLGSVVGVVAARFGETD